MKNLLRLIIPVCLLFCSHACKKDNYAAPESAFQGRIVYKGEPINVSQGDVFFELWESGWGKKIPINVAVAQDGSYSAVLFNGNYQLVIPRSQGPFIALPDATTHTDTARVQLNGSHTQDIEVLPYYMVRTPAFAVAARTVTATCKLEKIVTDTRAKNIERVVLYVNKTQFVDGLYNIANKTVAGADITDLSNVSLSLVVPAINPVQGYAFVRIGVKIDGVEDMLFSPVTKVTL